MPRKKVVKNKKDASINIEFKNVDKIIKAEKNRKIQKGTGHFWIFGSALAMILSYERSASIAWAILHGIFSWFYILYRLIQSF